MSYIEIVKHYEDCLNKYGDNNKGVDWPNKEDAKKRYRVMLDIIEYDKNNDDKANSSILDFGCGLGHLYEYILEEKYPYIYEGLDISSQFIAKCREKFPTIHFIQQDILKNWESDKTWDYICMNGVFTEKREMSYDDFFNYFKKMIKVVYTKCNKGITFNVMSKDVDWEREDLFHLPLNDLSKFLTTQVSRNFIIRYDYGLYEYTVYIYKDCTK